MAAGELGRGARRHRRRASARRSWRAAGTRSCTTSAAPATSAPWTACSRPGASTATTPTRTSARPPPGSGTRSGAATTGPAPTTRTPGSSCCSPRTSRPATTSTPTPSASWRASCAGAKLAVMDPRLSNTASVADYWLPTYPGSEAAVLLAMAERHPRRGPRRPRLRGALDELARVHGGRGEPGDGAHLRRFRGRPARALPRVHARRSRRRRAACRATGSWRWRGSSAGARGAFASHVWRGTRRRQPGRLAGGPGAPAPDRAHREPGDARAAPRPTPGTSTSPRSGRSRPPRRSGTSCSSRGSGRSATTRCRSCCRTS